MLGNRSTRSHRVTRRHLDDVHEPSHLHAVTVTVIWRKKLDHRRSTDCIRSSCIFCGRRIEGRTTSKASRCCGNYLSGIDARPAGGSWPSVGNPGLKCECRTGCSLFWGRIWWEGKAPVSARHIHFTNLNVPFSRLQLDQGKATDQRPRQNKEDKLPPVHELDRSPAVGQFTREI